MKPKFRMQCFLVMRRYWRGELGIVGKFLDNLFLPLEVLYRAIVNCRVWLYRHRWLPSVNLIPTVVSVGNLAVGGTGKTPFSRWIYEQSLKLGHVPGVISSSLARDEHELHKYWNPGGLFINAKSKARGACEAFSRGADLIIVDDGFQHLSLERDIDVLLIAAEHRSFRKCFPRGLMRESFDSLKRADVVIVTRKIADKAIAHELVAEIGSYIPNDKIGQVYLKPSSWIDIRGNEVSRPVGRSLVFTSIAEPETFIEVLDSVTQIKSNTIVYPDHYQYKEADVKLLREVAEGCNMVTTEKDAVKLRGFEDLLDDLAILRLDLEWEKGEANLIKLLGDQGDHLG